jgi:competence protein ComEC
MDFPFKTTIPSKVKLAAFPLAIIFALLGFLIFSRPDGKLHVNFCDVGQGDAIFLQTPKGRDILIDGGPDAKVLDCLSGKMPFYDRTLELMVLTHPQADHLVGLIEVLKRFKVEKILTTSATNNTPEFEAWQKAQSSKKAEVWQAKKGQKVALEDNFEGEILWPPDLFFADEINDTSIVLKINYFDFCLLLTGDAGKPVWLNLSSSGALNRCFLLKVPHHGSKNAIDEVLLSQVAPKIAVITVGKNNHFGHPSQEVLDLLKKYGVDILRTDEKGTIEIVSDGKKWWLK